MSACRSCSAPIVWAITDNGHKMPLDEGVHADGRLVVVGRMAGAPLVVSLTGAQLERLHAAEDRDDPARLELRRTHFQTCPDDRAWRRA